MVSPQAGSLYSDNYEPEFEDELDLSSFTYAMESDPWYQQWLIKGIERMTGQLRIWKLYKEYRDETRAANETFWHAACRKLELTPQFDLSKLNKAPSDGPLVVVSNHPYGVLDGLILCYMMSYIRKDFKVLTNSVLTRSPEVKDNLLPVDFSETPQALQTNLTSRKLSRETLKNGGAVGVFPAGGVSRISKWSDKIAMDTSWQPFIGQLIRQSEACVLPLYFHGQNSRLFQLASLASQTLRYSLYFKELADHIGSNIKVEIGEPIAYKDLPSHSDNHDLMKKLYNITYSLPSQPATK